MPCDTAVRVPCFSSTRPSFEFHRSQVAAPPFTATFAPSCLNRRASIFLPMLLLDWPWGSLYRRRKPLTATLFFVILSFWTAGADAQAAGLATEDCSGASNGTLCAKSTGVCRGGNCDTANRLCSLLDSTRLISTSGTPISGPFTSCNTGNPCLLGCQGASDSCITLSDFQNFNKLGMLPDGLVCDAGGTSICMAGKCSAEACSLRYCSGRGACQSGGAKTNNAPVCQCSAGWSGPTCNAKSKWICSGVLPGRLTAR